MAMQKKIAVRAGLSLLCKQMRAFANTIPSYKYAICQMILSKQHKNPSGSWEIGLGRGNSLCIDIYSKPFRLLYYRRSQVIFHVFVIFFLEICVAFVWPTLGDLPRSNFFVRLFFVSGHNLSKKLRPWSMTQSRPSMGQQIKNNSIIASGLFLSFATDSFM